MMQPLLSIENLSVDFLSENGSVNAVKNISIDVSKGEILEVSMLPSSNLIV